MQRIPKVFTTVPNFPDIDRLDFPPNLLKNICYVIESQNSGWKSKTSPEL